MRNMKSCFVVRMMVWAFPLLLGAGVGTVYAGSFESPHVNPHRSGPAAIGTITMKDGFNFRGTFTGT